VDVDEVRHGWTFLAPERKSSRRVMLPFWRVTWARRDIRASPNVRSQFAILALDTAERRR
jgi:hypothetical protein